MFLISLFFKIIYSYNFHLNCDSSNIKIPDIPGYDLIQVHVEFRHGARSPLHFSKNFPKTESKCDYTQLYSVNKETFTRFPSFRINVQSGKSISGGNCIYGQLLDRGFKQLKRIGNGLRINLIDSFKFLLPNFKNTSVKIRSTHTFRTFNSAASLLLGLYPDSSGQEMTINFGDKSFDVWKKSNFFCPSFQEIFNNLFENYMQKQANPIESDKVNNLSKKVGMQWIHLNDFSSSSKCDCNDFSSALSDNDFDTINHYKTKQMLYVYSNDKIIQSYQAFFLSQIYNDMIDKINGNSQHKLELWSVHDGNLISTIAFLGIPIEIWPPYASHISFLLYDNPIKHDPFIVISFNGTIVNCSLFNKIRIPLFEFGEKLTKYMDNKFFDICVSNNETYVRNQLHIFN